MQLNIWIKLSALQKAYRASSEAYPKESGGLLLGYRASPYEFVIETISKPGPSATHRTRSFVPDYDHDTELVLRTHQLSNGQTTYLGDWHSHPNTSRGHLSSMDRRALRSILRSDDASLDIALSMILAGMGDGEWSCSVWAAELIKTLIVFERIVAIPGKVNLFE